MSAWSHQPFRWLTLGKSIDALGNGIAPIALAFAVLDLGGSAGELGAVVGLYALADVLVTLFGGVLGDRFPRRVLMVCSMLGSGLAQAIAAVSLIGGFSSLWLLSVCGFAMGGIGALGGPSSSAITQQTVPASDLRQAIVIRRLTINIAMIAGNGLGGLLVVGFGSGWALAIDAATFVMAALCFVMVRVPSALTPSGESIWGQIGEGFRETMRHTWLWLLIAQALLYHLFYGGAAGVIGPIVIGDEFGRAAWGYALAAMMVGFVVGGLVTIRWRPRHALFVGTAFLALTAAFPIAMALSPSVALVLAGAFAHGFGLEIFSVGWDLSIQEQIPADKLARVYSFDMLGSYVARPVGLALTGVIASSTGYDVWLLVVGGVIVTSVVAALFSSDVRRLQRLS